MVSLDYVRGAVVYLKLIDIRMYLEQCQEMSRTVKMTHLNSRAQNVLQLAEGCRNTSQNICNSRSSIAAPSLS